MNGRTRGSTRRLAWRAATVVVVAAVLGAATTTAIPQTPAAAQAAGDPTATTTTVVPSTPATTPPASPGDPAATATTTTIPSPPATNPDGTPVDPTATTTTIVPDPFGASTEALSNGAYGGQSAFDLGSMAPIGAEVARARTVLAAAQDRYDAAQGAIDSTLGEFRRLADRIGDVGVEREDRVADASAAEASFRRRAIAAYVRGDDATRLLGVMDDPADYSRGKRYLEALAGLDRDAYDEYRRSIAGLDDRERSLVDDQARLQNLVAQLETERSTALAALLDARRCATAFAAGSHVCPPTFLFPVLGEVSFSDTWGAPRLAGTPDQHWHEGTDIMAPMGREIVAVEDGTLFKVGDAGLGGLRLWLHGASGVDYYYAHFSGFAPGMAEGTPVTQGTVVGYAGNTGDAAGGPSHLHFEIHPAGGAPVDPYPLLKAAWGTRPMPSQSAIMERLPSVVGTLPPEER